MIGATRHCEERSDGPVSLFVDWTGQGRIVMMVGLIGWCGMRGRARQVGFGARRLIAHIRLWVTA